VDNHVIFLLLLVTLSASDKRYKSAGEVPQHVLESMHSEKVHSPGFSIKGEARQGRPSYLDFQATTPVDPRAVDAMVGYSYPFMRNTIRKPPVSPPLCLSPSCFSSSTLISCPPVQLPFMTSSFGNPHSRTHAYGWEAEQAVEDAREVSDMTSNDIPSHVFVPA